MSAAHDFGKERFVSAAHENDEHTKGLVKGETYNYIRKVRIRQFLKKKVLLHHKHDDSVRC